MPSIFESLTQPWFLGPVCAVLSSCTWAAGSSIYGKLAKTYPAHAINSTRAALAFPMFFVITLSTVSGQAALTSPQQILPALGWSTISIVSSYALADLTFLIATLKLGVPGALAISSTFPLWSALAGTLFRGEALTTQSLLGVVLVVLGSALVILSQKKANEIKTRVGGAVLEFDAQSIKRQQRDTRIGVVLAIVTSALWAGNVITVSQATQHAPPPTVNLLRMGLALILCPTIAATIAPLTRQTIKPLFLSLKDLKRFAPIILLECVGGSSFYTYSLKHTTLAVGSALTSLAPVLSVPVVLVMGLEKPSLSKTLGVLCAVAGCVLLSLATVANR